MAYRECVIVFDQNEHGIFFTGQIVTGRVIINLNKPKKLKGIKLHISGYAQCQWREVHGRKRPDMSSKRHKRKTYYGREDYIATTTYLVGSEESKNFTMDAGTYTYTFACPIPLNCPSSFEGTFGHIRYLTKVAFMRSGASDRTYNVGFTVLRLLNLNHESPILKEPAGNEALENFCFLHTNPVHLHVDLQQTGFVPGQMVLVSAFVNNESQIDCKKLIILLNLRATYVSELPRMRIVSDKICLVKKICGPVPHQSQRRFDETLRIPPTPPSSEMLSKIVRVTYEICVVASMNHLMRNPKAVIPITIGNVPLTFSAQIGSRLASDNLPTTSNYCRSQSQTDTNENNNEENLSAVEADTEDIEDGTVEIELPPPTYEEAMYMTANIADNDANTVSDETHFTPRYPVYDVDNLAAANASNRTPQRPAPSLPQKRRRRKKKRLSKLNPNEGKTPIESPVEI